MSKSVKNKNRSVVFISGIFNILHPGHIRLFRFAAELGTTLVVGLRARRENESELLDNDERLQALRSISLIDEVLLMEDLQTTLQQVKPDIVVKGREFKHQENSESEIISPWHGRLIFSSGESQFNSVDFFNEPSLNGVREFPASYRQYISRHKISPSQILQSLSDIASKRVAVIGDIIIDEYVDCDPVGLSREETTVVVTPTKNKLFIGGASIVALHAKSFGADVDFYSVCGLDERADWLENSLCKQGVNNYLYRDETRPTTLKKRYRSQNKALLRVNEYRSHSLSQQLMAKMLEDFEKNIRDYDLVVFSDFSYGLLTSELVNALQDIAKRNGVKMVADSQTSSQRGDLSKFSNLTLVTPTEIEARLAIDNLDNDIGLAEVSHKLGEQLNSQHVVITLGAEGAVILDLTDPAQPRLDSLPALNNNPVDVSGAGDLLLVTTSLMLQTGCDLWHASMMGMVASSIHVGRVGNNPIDVSVLNRYLEKL